MEILLREAYISLHEAALKERGMEIVPDTWNAISKMFLKLSKLAAGAGRSKLDDYPEIQAELGPSFALLRQVGDSLGPEAQELVRTTFEDIEALVARDQSPRAVFEMWALAHERFQSLQPLQDQTWMAGFLKMKPALKKYPHVKRVVDRNIFTLKHSNVRAAFKVMHAASISGRTDERQEYIDRCTTFWHAFKRPCAFHRIDRPSTSPCSFGALNAWMQHLPRGPGAVKQLGNLQHPVHETIFDNAARPRRCGNCRGPFDPPSF